MNMNVFNPNYVYVLKLHEVEIRKLLFNLYFVVNINGKRFENRTFFQRNVLKYPFGVIIGAFPI